MKTYRVHLKDSLLAALFGVPVGAIIGGLGIGLYTFVTSRAEGIRFPDAMGTGLFFSLFAALLGVPPALLYGAPFHALLARRGHSNYLISTAIGAAPGAMLTIAQPVGMSLFILYFGACMAIPAQWLAGRRAASHDGR